MAFGQQSGPPASRQQLAALVSLLEAAGHVDFRDARGPLGLTQRQANGKFTRDEADAFITQLEERADSADPNGSCEVEPPTPAAPVARPKQTATLSAAQQALRRIPDHELAAELQRRGWIVVEP